MDLDVTECHQEIIQIFSVSNEKQSGLTTNINKKTAEMTESNWITFESKKLEIRITMTDIDKKSAEITFKMYFKKGLSLILSLLFILNSL